MLERPLLEPGQPSQFRIVIPQTLSIARSQALALSTWDTVAKKTFNPLSGRSTENHINEVFGVLEALVQERKRAKKGGAEGLGRVYRLFCLVLCARAFCLCTRFMQDPREPEEGTGSPVWIPNTLPELPAAYH